MENTSRKAFKEYCNLLENNYQNTDNEYDIYIQNLKELPDVFVCANDFIAFDLMQILRQLNIQVPEDICLCGFDDSPAAKLITPPLTSIHIHNEILGVCAIDLLLSRIKDPTLNYRTVYTETNIVYRESVNIAPTK